MADIDTGSNPFLRRSYELTGAEDAATLYDEALTAGALVCPASLSLAEGGAGVFEQPAAPSDRQTAAVNAAKMRFFIKNPPFLLLYTLFLKLQPFPQA